MQSVRTIALITLIQINIDLHLPFSFSLSSRCDVGQFVPQLSQLNCGRLWFIDKHTAYLSIRQIFQHWSRHPQSWWRNVPGRASHWLEKTSKTLWIYRVLLPSFTKRVFTNPGPNESRTSHHLGAQEQIFANKRVNIKVNNYIVQLLLYSGLYRNNYFFVV